MVNPAQSLAALPNSPLALTGRRHGLANPIFRRPWLSNENELIGPLSTPRPSPFTGSSAYNGRVLSADNTILVQPVRLHLVQCPRCVKHDVAQACVVCDGSKYRTSDGIGRCTRTSFGPLGSAPLAFRRRRGNGGENSKTPIGSVSDILKSDFSLKSGHRNFCFWLLFAGRESSDRRQRSVGEECRVRDSILSRRRQAKSTLSSYFN